MTTINEPIRLFNYRVINLIPHLPIIPHPSLSHTQVGHIFYK